MSRLALVLLALCLAWVNVSCETQASPSTAATSSKQTVAIAGVVLNASTSQPVARALVQIGQQSILTEHDGKFQFTAASGTSALLRVTKPGYYDGVGQTSAAKHVTFGAGADSVKVYLFPEGLITGALTAPNGDPVSGVLIQALRKTGDESVSWAIAGQIVSNSEGQFRLPLSAGDYVVETHYVADQPIRQQAILPTVSPDPANGGDSNGTSAIHLSSGTEQHLDLRPELRATHDVHVRTDGIYTLDFLRIEAHLLNGLSFFPTSRPTGTPGDYLVTMPTGSYLLTLSTGDRDGGGYAQSAATIGDSETALVVMQITKSAPIPVEVLVDSTSSTASDNSPPSVQQLGLHFVRTDRGAPAATESIYLRSSHGGVAAFSITPGRYRLLAQQLSHWYIESATVGGTDLLTQDLDVEAGGTSAPLRIVVSSNTATIMGKVDSNGVPGANYWVYLVATLPGVNPVTSAVSGGDGTFSHPSLPPGSYRAVAFETRRSDDFTDPGTLERLAPYMKSISVGAGEIGNVELDAVPTVESTQ